MGPFPPLPIFEVAMYLFLEIGPDIKKGIKAKKMNNGMEKKRTFSADLVCVNKQVCSC